MEAFINLVVAGAVSGAIYSLIASSLVLSYTATGIFNLSYAGTAFAAAMIYYELHSPAGQQWPSWAAAIVVVGVFCPLLGLMLNSLIFKRMSGASDAAKIMVTVGLLEAIPYGVLFVIEKLITVGHLNIPDNSNVYSPPGLGPSPVHTYHPFGQVVVNSDQLVVFVVAALCAFALWYMLRRTPMGLRMRAVVDQSELATLRGVDRDQASRQAWVIGSVLAGLAGVIGAPIINSLLPDSYTSIMIVACAAAVVGGLRSIPLAFLGGLMLGVADNLVAYYASFAKNISGFYNSLPFAVLFIGLIVLGRDKSRRAGAARNDPPRPDYLAGIPAWRRRLPWAVGTVGLVLTIFFWAGSFWLGNIEQGLAYGLIFMSFVVVTGLGGMVSLAQAALATAGGLTAGMAVHRFHWPYGPSLLLGVAVAVVLGTVVALPALRLGGVPLALATLALALLADNVLFQWNWLRNEEAGWKLNPPSIGGLHLSDAKTFTIILLICCLLFSLMIRNLRRSATGRAIDAVRSAEPAAATSGMAPVAVKLKLFALSAAMAGFGGIILATVHGTATNTAIPALLGLIWLANVVLFGIRRPGGAVLAGLAAVLFPAFLQTGFHLSWLPSFIGWNGTKSVNLAPMLFGLGAINLAKNPDGLLALSAQNRHEARKRREAKRLATVAAVPTESPEDLALAGLSGVSLTSASSPDERAKDSTAVDGRGAEPEQTRGLEVRDLWGGYGDLEVLRGVSLVVRPGSITALLGANGAGKTTLCRTIAGSLAAQRGSVLLDGRAMDDLGAVGRSRAGILLAPESRGIFPGLSVRENLALRLGPSEIEAVYDRFGVLASRRNLAAGYLSGGEQQMLALAPVIIRAPEVLIADEPSLGLAPMVVTTILELFSELRERGVALLIVEEKARDILSIADRVAFLRLGRLAWSGPREDVDEQQLVASYLHV